MKLKIFALLLLQFTIANSMLRHVARALTANNRTLPYSRLLLRHYITQEGKEATEKEAKENFDATVEDVDKAISNLYKKHYTAQNTKALLVNCYRLSS